MRKQDLFLGGFLILVGVLFLLYNIGILAANIGFFILSLGLMSGYFMLGRLGFLIIGFILMGLSAGNIFADLAYLTMELKVFMLSLVLGILALAFFAKSRNRIFLILALFLWSIGAYSLLKNFLGSSPIWALFLLFGFSFFIYYLWGYRKLGIVWPKNIGRGLSLLALLIYLLSKASSRIDIWKVIGYIWPLGLVAIGIRIIYKGIRTSRKE